MYVAMLLRTKKRTSALEILNMVVIPQLVNFSHRFIGIGILQHLPFCLFLIYTLNICVP